MKLPLYAKRLAALMQQAKWRDEDLSVAAGVSARQIGGLRNGRVDQMRPATARVLAAALAAQLKRPVSQQYVAGDPDAES
jgi:transcriptional regulator with XRE-family HTH domain